MASYHGLGTHLRFQGLSLSYDLDRRFYSNALILIMNVGPKGSPAGRLVSRILWPVKANDNDATVVVRDESQASNSGTYKHALRVLESVP